MTQRAEIIFVTLVVPLILGISLFYPDTNQLYLHALVITCGSLFIAILTGNLLYARLHIYRIKPAVLCAIYLVTFLSGGLLCMLNKAHLEEDYFAARNSNFLKIRINEEPQVKNNIIRFKAAVIQSFNNSIQAQASGHLLVSIKLDSLPIHTYSYGDELIIPSLFKEVPEPRNPNQFDARSWLAQQNIYHQVFLNADQVEPGNENTGNPLIAYAIALRREKVEMLQKLLKSQEAFAVASTLILGYRSDLSLETLQAYSKTGTIHALSVSGMHVGIIYIVLNLALSRLDRKGYTRWIKLILILSLIWFYALITGLTPSVLRAAIMLSALLLAKSLRKTVNSYNILAFSAFCMLIVNPFQLFDLGFQLSYISVIGLIFLQPKINNWYTGKSKLLTSLWSALSLSLAAHITTFPLAVYYFHQFPIYFLIGNLFLVIPVAIMMYMGLIILIFNLTFLGPVFEWVINSTNRGLKFIAELPFSTISEIWINKWELLLLVGGITLLCYALIFYRKWMLYAALGLTLALVTSLTLQTANHHRQRKLIFFSLPTNHAVAFLQGDKAVIITDLQPSAPAYRVNIQPFLDQTQIKQVKIIQPHETYRTKKLMISGHQAHFYSQTILLADTCFNAKHLLQDQHFNTVLLSSNSRVNLGQLLLQTSPGHLVVDGSNNTFAAERYENAAKKFNVPVQNLKKIKAYLVNLK